MGEKGGGEREREGETGSLEDIQREREKGRERLYREGEKERDSKGGRETEGEKGGEGKETEKEGQRN